MDKDQVLKKLDIIARQASKPGYAIGVDGLIKVISQVESLYAELELLRAMRKRVEGLADGWSKGDIFRHTFFLKELRAALGDSHE